MANSCLQVRQVCRLFVRSFFNFPRICSQMDCPSKSAHCSLVFLLDVSMGNTLGAKLSFSSQAQRDKNIPVLNAELISTWNSIIPSFHAPAQVVYICCATIKCKTEAMLHFSVPTKEELNGPFFAFHVLVSCVAVIIFVALLDPHNKRLLRLIETSSLGSGCASILAVASCFVYSTSQKSGMEKTY